MKRYVLLLVEGRYVIEEYDPIQTSADQLCAEKRPSMILGDFSSSEEARIAPLEDSDRVKFNSF